MASGHRGGSTLFASIRHNIYGVKRAFLLLLVACASAPAPQPPPPLVHGPQLIPVYEWDKDKTLTAFRGQMIELIRARDERRLFDHVDPNVRISFGPGSGIGA